MRARCIGKERNEKGVIVKYILKSESGDRIETTGKEIKEGIKRGALAVVNLQIDKAGRLVDKAEEKEKPARKESQKPEQTSNKRIITKDVARKEVKDYIDMMKKSYTTDNDGAEKFIKDFTGEGNVILGRDKNGKADIKTVCRMTPATKHYFEILIKQIEDKALKDEVHASRYDCTALMVELPESIKKFMQSAGLDDCIAEAMFYQAAQNKKLALINCGYEDMGDGFVGEVILTANYDKAKKFILEKVKEESENNEVSPTEIMLQGNYVQGDNMLGKVFILKLYAEIQKHDVSYYKDQVLAKASDLNFFGKTGLDIAKLSNEEQAEAIRNALRRETCGLHYLALKLGVLPQRDDWDTPEEKEIEDKITAEAKRLAEETTCMDWIFIK